MIIPDLGEAAKALGRVVGAIVNDEPVLTTDEVLAERLAECENCDRLDKSSRQCLECTCFVDLKANLSTETCPKKKWKR